MLLFCERVVVFYEWIQLLKLHFIDKVLSVKWRMNYFLREYHAHCFRLQLIWCASLLRIVQKKKRERPVAKLGQRYLIVTLDPHGTPKGYLKEKLDF